MEGADEVKLAVPHSNNLAYRIFAIVDAHDYADINAFTNQFRDAMGWVVEYVGDGIR